MTALHRRGRAALTVTCIVAALSSCGGGRKPDTAVLEHDPAALVGIWTVRDIGGADLVLRMGNGADIFTACGVLYGGWGADASGAFLGGGSSASSSCVAPEPADEPLPPPFRWLTDATAFRLQGQERLLLDADGTTVARLVPGAQAPVGEDQHAILAAPIEQNERLREKVQPAAGLPSDLRPAQPNEIVGRWAAAAPDPRQRAPGQEPHVTFASDESWSSSDGCNGTSGRWRIPAPGLLLATGSGTTAVGCDNVELEPEGLRLAGLTAATGGPGTELVLLDGDAKPVRRLRRG